MKVTRLDLPVMASLMEENGRRLDCNPYLSGGFEARVLLKKLDAEKQPLKDLTAGGLKGIFNGPRFPRHYVQDPAHGVPFLGSTDILAADLSGLPMISKKQVKARPELMIDQDWTLITCSGTIGRMVYSRADMKGMAGSQHFMRIVANRTKILPGYLYAYLSSRFGVALIVSGTYGSIIQHLEPSHIADLPVPRLGDALEQKIHDLIYSAAQKRSIASAKKTEAIRTLYEEFELQVIPPTESPTDFATFTVNKSQMLRLDAFNYSPKSLLAANELSNCCNVSKKLGDIAQVFTPGIFKRVYAGESSFGYPYFSGSELFQIAPEPRGFLSKKVPNIENYLVNKDWLLVQDAGQTGGLIGRLLRVPPYADQSAVSNHLMRIVPTCKNEAAYLFALLSSPHGYRAIVRHAFGTSIPQLDPNHIAQIQVPYPNPEIRSKIAKPILDAWQLLDEADEEENLAVRKVEQTIENASK
jgi:type I restriction enzyme, S subunit